MYIYIWLTENYVSLQITITYVQTDSENIKTLLTLSTLTELDVS